VPVSSAPVTVPGDETPTETATTTEGAGQGAQQPALSFPR
jgi:hypothetical protein